MSTHTARRFLRAVGAIATFFGVTGIARGIDGVWVSPDPSDDQRAVDGSWLASVDSEFRFFAAWYAAAGTQMLRLAKCPAPDPRAIHWLGAAWIAAAVGRGLSVRTHGRPHALYVALMGVELTIGSVLLRGVDRDGMPRRGVT